MIDAEPSLREADRQPQHDRLAAVIGSLQDALFMLDREGRVTLANSAGEALLRSLDQSCLGICSRCPNQSERRGGEDDPRSCLRCLADYRQRARSFTVTVGTRVLSIQGTSVRGLGGEEIERVFLARDVTQKSLEAAEQARQERLAVLGEVAAVMAHELSSPLAAISMFSQMLRDGLDEGSPLRAHAEVVHRNTLSCARTLRSLLDMACSPVAEPEELDPHDLVDEVVELLGPLAQRHRARLAIDAESAGAWLRADPIQLRQALINLVMNAIQATAAEEGGKVTVGTLVRDDQVVIRVHDNGPGIPPELRQRIFEPFFTTKPPGQGTGLGLPTTRRLVTSQGGRLVLRDDDTVGTTFEIILPRLTPPAAAARQRDPAALESETNTTRRGGLGARAVLAEDG